MKLIRNIASLAVVALCVTVMSQTFAADETPAEANAPSAPIKHRSAPDTLMFTADEFSEIQSRVAGAGGSGDGAGDANDGIEDATLFLSTILYAGPNDWTIWINGAPVSANQGFKSFQVVEITPNSVDLLVPLSAQGMRPVHLQPNQTFVAKTGIVVEGKYP
jgi:hypothetical protein